MLDLLLIKFNEMTLSINQILHKIKSISCQHHLATVIPDNLDEKNQEKYLKKCFEALSEIEQVLYQASEMKEEYQKLQQFLQKQQTEIRKHIGVEQQMKLYTDGLKLQLQQSEKQKKQLLANSKQLMKNLKLKNQLLFSQMSQLKKKQFQRRNKESPSIDRKTQSLKKIIKTEYIQRNFKDQEKEKQKRHIKLPFYKLQAKQKQKLPTHSSSHKKQKISSAGKKRATQLLNSRKKQIQRFSNFTLLTYMNKQKKQKSCSKSKSLKGVSKVQKKTYLNSKNLQSAKQRHKKIQNRSIFSVSSINYKTQSKKKQ